MKQQLCAAALLLAAVLSGCGAGSGDPGTQVPGAASVEVKAFSSAGAASRTGASSGSPVTTLATAAVAVPSGRLLASNCFQCHGTNGVSSTGFDSLAALPAAEIYGALKEMQTATDKGIMGVHALGYSDEQIRALAGYFATQTR